MAAKKTTKKKSSTKKAASRKAKATASKTKKAPAKKAPAKKAPAKKVPAKKAAPKRARRSASAGLEAARVVAGEAEKSVADYGDDLVSGKKSVAAQAARVLDEVLALKPEAVIPIIDRYARVIGGPDKRPAQSAANALPQMARVAPARVARHLPKLKESFDDATAPGKDGLVRTFAGLCTASVAYQKRLEDVLNKGLDEADAKTLIAWTEVVLPALKGEPHARARATVEARLGRIPKVHAQKIADFLGIKLRLRYR